MSGYINDFFGYRASDNSENAISTALQMKCPFGQGKCTKILSRLRVPAGACSIRAKSPNSPNVICCPIRLYADDYKLLKIIAKKAFNREMNLYAGRVAIHKAKQERGAVAVFGHGWGGELHLPQRHGVGSYYVDWVLAWLDEDGNLKEFTAIEVQTIDTTGSYQIAREALLKNREIISDTVGFNWENVNKRIIPQLIYKGQVLQREEMCKTGLFFVAPKPIYDRVLTRLGGKDKLPAFPSQPASIHFVAYDEIKSPEIGEIAPLGVIEEHCTTVYKVQEAFSALTLPDINVYRDAIIRSLYGTE